MVLLNSHGGNKPFLHGLAQEWRRRFGLTVYVMDTCNSLYDRYAAGVMDTPPALEVHAGEDETSQLLCEYPDTSESPLGICRGKKTLGSPPRWIPPASSAPPIWPPGKKARS